MKAVQARALIDRENGELIEATTRTDLRDIRAYERYARRTGLGDMTENKITASSIMVWNALKRAGLPEAQCTFEEFDDHLIAIEEEAIDIFPTQTSGEISSPSLSPQELP